jgi:WD40 repeat protein
MTGAIAISPDNSWLAIGQNNRIRIVKVATLEEEFQFKTTDMVMTVDFSPNGEILASGTGFQDPAVSLWNLETRESLGRLKGHTKYLRQVAFSSSGNLLASASADQTLRLWETETWSEVARLRGHQQEVWALAFAADGHALVSAAKDGEIRIWNPKPRSHENWPLILPDLRVNSTSFSSDSKMIATANVDGSVSIRDTRDLREIQKLTELGEDNRGVLFSPRHPLLAVGSATSSIRLLDPERPEVIRKLRGAESGLLLPKAFTADGSKLLSLETSRTSNRFVLWEVETGKEISAWAVPQETRDVALSPDGDLVVTAHSDGSMYLWDTQHGQSEALGGDHSEAVGNVAFYPDGRRVVATSLFGDTATWDLRERKKLSKQSNMHMQSIHSLAFSPDGRRLITGGSAGESVKLWDVSTGRGMGLLVGHGFTFHHVEVSPDGNVILAINVRGQPQLWRVPSWDEIKVVENERFRTDLHSPASGTAQGLALRFSRQF